MKKLTKSIAFAAVFLIAAAGVFLATWDIPAPTTQVEKTLPDDRFPK